MIKAVAYSHEMAKTWNEFVMQSKNGTFLFCRDFMDYHAARFNDASLLFFDQSDRLCGLIPANYNKESKTIFSHGGLTYGGLVVNHKAVQTTVMEMLAAAAEYYSENLGAEQLVYKPTPYIYHTLPAEEDLYALFRAEATLVQRCVSSALCPANHPKQRQSRRGGVVRATKLGMTVEEVACAQSEEVKDFHDMLSEILRNRHSVSPVHSLEEMQLLMQRFPTEIKLFVTKHRGKVIAGSWVFITPRVAHTQYLATSDEGKQSGAEDMLIDWLISVRFKSMPYFDFGISTERGGTYLNQGLIFEKEGFGARSVCYDTYKLNLQKALHNLKESI